LLEEKTAKMGLGESQPLNSTRGRFLKDIAISLSALHATMTTNSMKLSHTSLQKSYNVSLFKKNSRKRCKKVWQMAPYPMKNQSQWLI
jgi:hypothetical protein